VASHQGPLQLADMWLVPYRNKYLDELIELCYEGIQAAEDIFAVNEKGSAAWEAMKQLPSYMTLWKQSGGDLKAYMQAEEEVDRKNRALREQLWREELRANARQWRAVKGALYSAANISKMLYPNSTKDAEIQKIRSSRRNILHHALGPALTETFANHCRTVRNHIEHLDERIDTWVLSSPTHSRKWVGPDVQPLSEGENPNTLFLSFNNKAFVVYFGSDKTDLRPLIEGFERLLEASIRVLHRTRSGEEPSEELVRLLLPEPVSRRWTSPPSASKDPAM
jgi:hypothetical protein